MSTLAIITARGGSKRIPRKNIKSFLGKPIIAYSIEAAIKSEIFDEVMVSTDDDKIARIAKEYGAKVPFTRTSEAANDHATLSDVIIEVLQNYKEQAKEFAHVCCILPTAPFVTAKNLQKAHMTLLSTDATSVFPAVAFSYPIQRSLEINSNGFCQMVWPEHLNSRSQDLPKRYHDSGQFYFLETESFLKEKRLFTTQAQIIKVSEKEVQDIDTETDWTIAEMKYRLLMEESV